MHFCRSQTPRVLHILSLPVFYKILLESFMIDALGYKSWLEPLDAYNFLVQKYTFNPV